MVPDAELANTLHMTEALHVTVDLFRRSPLDENDTKNEASLEMEEIAMEEDPYADEVSDEDTFDDVWPGEAHQFEAGDITSPVPKELASKSTAQIGLPCVEACVRNSFRARFAEGHQPRS